MFLRSLFIVVALVISLDVTNSQVPNANAQAPAKNQRAQNAEVNHNDPMVAELLADPFLQERISTDLIKFKEEFEKKIESYEGKIKRYNATALKIIRKGRNIVHVLNNLNEFVRRVVVKYPTAPRYNIPNIVGWVEGLKDLPDLTPPISATPQAQPQPAAATEQQVQPDVGTQQQATGAQQAAETGQTAEGTGQKTTGAEETSKVEKTPQQKLQDLIQARIKWLSPHFSVYLQRRLAGMKQRYQSSKRQVENYAELITENKFILANMRDLLKEIVKKSDQKKTRSSDIRKIAQKWMKQNKGTLPKPDPKPADANPLADPKSPSVNPAVLDWPFPEPKSKLPVAAFSTPI